MTFPAVGPFKAMFALYYLERFALSRTVRFQAMAEGDKVFVAGWGIGMALGELCPSLAHELPQRQRDDSAVNTRKCTVLVGILYHTEFGEEIARIVRPYYKRASAHWCLIHLEFVLCELRKAGSCGARIYNEPSSAMLQKYAGCTKGPAWARKAKAPVIDPHPQKRSRQSLLEEYLRHRP